MSDTDAKVGDVELKNDSGALKSGLVTADDVVVDGKVEQYFVGDAELDKFLKRVRADYGELKFRLGKKFTFRPSRTIITPTKLNFWAENGVDDNNDGGWRRYYMLQVLHEVGHALSKHRMYVTDITRLKMEREAWEKARELAKKYCVQYDEDFVEGVLDTYREWLHRRSKCPKCGLTRCQTDGGEYRCVACENFGDF